MTNKITGQIIKYDNEKRFGFIQTDNGKEIFFHLNQYRPNKLPTIGEHIIFELGSDKQGRTCANNIQEHTFVLKKEQKQQVQQQKESKKQWALNLMIGIATAYLTLCLIRSYLIGNYAFSIFILVLSIISFMTYWYDKLCANNDERRVPEKVLLFLDFFGGWVGASFAHKLLNHKSTKPTFRFKFYLVVFLHLLPNLIALYYFIKSRFL